MKQTPSVGAIIVLCVIAFGPHWVAAAPVPKDAGKLSPPTQEELVAAVQNLKAIGLAVQVHQESNKRFPNNIYTVKGEALLSWRVRVLPYLEEGELYSEFRCDEPWDSDHNKKLIAKMPKVYAPIRVKAKPGETFYRVFAGKAAPFGPDKGADGNGLTVAAFTDGLSNTGLVFEAAEPVIWTKPDGLPFEEKKPLPKLGGLFDGEAHVLMGDGNVFRMQKDAPSDELRKLIMHADATPIDVDKLRAK